MTPTISIPDDARELLEEQAPTYFEEIRDTGTVQSHKKIIPINGGSILFGEQHGDFIIAVVSHHTDAQFTDAQQTLNTFLENNCNIDTELNPAEYDKQLVYRFKKTSL